MFKKAKPFFIIVQSPLHVGSGTELGLVDMPIQRERHTGFPKIEGSGLKGCIREAFEEFREEIQVGNKKVNGGNRLETILLAFGPEKGDEHAGALGFTDARLLLFPVKSMKGVFAWITCPTVLERFKTDLELCKNSGAIKKHFFENKKVPSEKTISNFGELGINGKIVLEEYTFDVKHEQITREFAEWLAVMLDMGEINKKLVILSNDDFCDFVNLSTEVITRTRINQATGTVQSGALFTEEYLPSESVLYSLALATPIFKEKQEDKGIFAQNGKAEEDLVMEYFTNGLAEVIQIGGNATIGKGIVRTKIWEDKNER